MGANRIETQVSRDLYHRELVRADNALSFPKHDGKGIAIATGLNHSNYAAASPARRPPFTRQRSSGGQPKGSAGYFESPSERKALNFIEQLAGFELTPGETFILGSLVVLASPMLAVGMLAGCERDLIPKAPPKEEPHEELCGGVKCELPNAISACLEDQCRIDRCLEGFSNANGLDEDGCECREAEGGCNHPPELETIGDKTVNEGEELRFRVQAADPDGDELQFFAENLPGGATFNQDTRSFSWTPTFEQAGIYENIRFTVTDGNLLDEEVISITVNNVNSPPTLAEIGDQSVNENEMLEFVVSATDPDGDNLTYSADGLPAGADLNPATGRFIWTPSFEQAGEYWVTFTVTDDRVPNLSDGQEVAITVNDVNRLPVMDLISNKTVNENQLLTVNVRSSDPDGDALTYVGENLPAGATVDPTTGTLTWTPTFAQAGVYPNVGITASDGGLSVTQRFDINVVNVNGPPAIDPIPDQTVNENQLLTVPVSASDPDGDSLAFSGENLPAGATVNPTTGALTWTPTFEQAGVYPNVGITASDGDMSVTRQFSITVNEVNREPAMNPISNRSVNENESLIVTVTATDPDGDVLTFSGENLPEGAIVDPISGGLTWTPTFEQAGVYPNVGITASDGDLSVTQRFDINVVNMNGPPVMEPVFDQTVDENEPLIISVTASDPDGDVLTFSGEDLPAGATVDPTTGTFSWTPTFDQAGVYPNVGITANDGYLSVVHRFLITVNNVNRAPTLYPIGDKMVEEGARLAFALNGVDPDGETLTYRAVGLPAGAELNPETGRFNWAPTRAQVGDHEITFEISDGDLTASETINIEVRGVMEILESQITFAAADSWDPALIWTGSEYGVSWLDNRGIKREIYFTRVDALGNKIGEDVQITNAAVDPQAPSLVWTGTEYGVTWNDRRYDNGDNNEIMLARINASGDKIGEDVRITNDAATSMSPSLVWTGSEYGVSWTDMRDSAYGEIYFTRIDALGNNIGGNVRVTSDNKASVSPSLVWTGSEFGVSWSDYSEIYLARIDASGNKIGEDVQISDAPETANVPSLVWTGSGYGVSWYDYRMWWGNEEIYFARIDSSGNKIGGDVRITNAPDWSLYPSLVWTGSEYGVSWSDDRDRNRNVYFARIGASGNKIGEDVRITNFTGITSFPRSTSLVWTGTEYGVSWNDDRDGNNEIYFARITGNFTPTP